MSLSPVDHFLLAHNQREHEYWLQQNVFQTNELRQQLAEQAAANQGRKAIIDALVAAYEIEDWETIEAILGDYNSRNAIYQAKYFSTLQSMMPVSYTHLDVYKRQPRQEREAVHGEFRVGIKHRPSGPPGKGASRTTRRRARRRPRSRRVSPCLGAALP